MRVFATGLGVLSLLWALIVMADAYRWADDQGRVHYGDRAPQGADWREITFQDSSQDNPDPGLRDSEVQMLRNIDEGPATSVQRALPPAQVDSAIATRQRHCQQARTDLDAVRDRMRAGYRARDYADLQQREQSAKREIRQNCR